MSIRVGFVVDSSCDLPPEYLQQYAITVVPSHIQLGNTRVRDERDPAATLQWLQTLDRAHAAESTSTPFSSGEFKSLFLDKLIFEYEFVFVITTMRTRSNCFANARAVEGEIVREAVSPRFQRGMKAPFGMRVIDSANVSAAYAALVAYLAQQAPSCGSFLELIELAERMVSTVVGYFVPNDLETMYERSKQANRDQSVGWFKYRVGTILDMKPIIRVEAGDSHPVGKARGFEPAVEQLCQVIEREAARGLQSPIVCVAYGGPLEELRRIAPYAAVKGRLAQAGVQVVESICGLGVAVAIGPKAFAVGLLAHPHTF
ncbi:DegV family protein [Caldimonas brevitalea]|uniref:DegV family protein n=1 Tax=Caldimonas brevitalea TaxID=413882 RepID=A0A0G3BGR4_9BURK|nr:DegV family protein [Caldimonas brevitalea]AKJ28522.1 hypothetical protein AAW51_1831 [Caldimonas brevitalea]